ncbi:B12-binding domain-containing radical SAM protein [bacterium]|nr:B12-binding domain-containing radical SAM protein [bacterium]
MRSEFDMSRKTHRPTMALIYPPTNAVTVSPSLGLGYLAACLQQADYGVQLYDLARRHMTFKQMVRQLAETRPKYIGLSISTPNYHNSSKIAQMLRSLPYRPTIILGGPHVSVYPRAALTEFDGDYVLKKESEYSLIELLNTLEDGGDPSGVNGIAFKPNGEIIETEDAPIPRDLDELPWPAWNLIQPQVYPPIPHQLFVKNLPVAPVLTSRGCPFNCNFCASTYLFGAKIRRRDLKDVVDEMFYLVDNFGIKEIHIEDDNPTLVKKHIYGLCDELLSRDRPLSWKFPNGIMVKTADEELLRKMRKAGCYQISLGIETVNEETEIGKDVPIGRLKDITKIAKEIGMQTNGLFVVGLPNETDNMIKRTIEQARQFGLDFAHFGAYVPLPGSSWGEEAIKDRSDFAQINFFSVTQRKDDDAKRVKGYQRSAVLGFYLRPRSIWRILKMLKPRQLSGFLYTFRRYVFG